MKYPVFLALALLAMVQPAKAQGLDLSMALGDTPLEIDSAGGIEWNQEKRTVAADGHVVIRFGAYTLAAERVQGSYVEVDGKPQAQQLRADGLVRFTGVDQTGAANAALFDIATKELQLLGSPATVRSIEQTLSAPELRYNIENRQIKALGGASLSGAQGTLTATSITALLEKSAAPKKTGGTDKLALKSASALGDVRLQTATESLTGDSGQYDAKSGIAVVTGHVRLERAGSYLLGSRAEVNMQTGQSRLVQSGGDGRVRGQIIPQTLRKAETDR
ncbi:MAG: hypothetical protein INF44_00710 [Thalassospira sp.]|nr:hypothetical protein [Thalassospira sp.]